MNSVLTFGLSFAAFFSSGWIFACSSAFCLAELSNISSSALFRGVLLDSGVLFGSMLLFGMSAFRLVLLGRKLVSALSYFCCSSACSEHDTKRAMHRSRIIAFVPPIILKDSYCTSVYKPSRLNSVGLSA